MNEVTTQEGQQQEPAAAGAAGAAEVVAGIEWGGFVISHIERDLNMVETGQRNEQESEEEAAVPEVEPPAIGVR